MDLFKNRLSPVNQKAIKGFTLIELILVIIILGIMAVGISGFITLSTQTYVNASNRDELIGNARFAIERLNRDLRNSVPNSVRESSWFGGSIKCIQFTPIIASTVYTDIPVAPEPASKILSVIPFNDNEGNSYQCNVLTGCNDVVIVYPLNEGDVYDDPTTASGKKFRIDNVDTSVEPWLINLVNDQNIVFDEDSPTQRLYIANEQVSYCVVPVPQANTSTLIRFREDIGEGDQAYPADSTRSYMAGYLDNVTFNYQPATLKRNAVVQMRLGFAKDDETYVFDHEVHINNVP